MHATFSPLDAEQTVVVEPALRRGVAGQTRNPTSGRRLRV